MDGHDIRSLRVYDLRGMMGNVNQEAILFNDTIFNNIAFGVKNATMEQVIEAAKIANAHDFHNRDGRCIQYLYQDQRLPPVGRTASARLSIARAILKNPPILILDEATSALSTARAKARTAGSGTSHEGPHDSGYRTPALYYQECFADMCNA